MLLTLKLVNDKIDIKLYKVLFILIEVEENDKSVQT